MVRVLNVKRPGAADAATADFVVNPIPLEEE
jgi:hypothetical protein